MFSPLFINQITVPVYILFLHNSYQFVLLGQLQCLTFFFFKESLFFCSKLVSFTFTFKWTQSSPSNGAILSNGPILISNRLHPEVSILSILFEAFCCSTLIWDGTLKTGDILCVLVSVFSDRTFASGADIKSLSVNPWNVSSFEDEKSRHWPCWIVLSTTK